MSIEKPSFFHVKCELCGGDDSEIIVSQDSLVREQDREQQLTKSFYRTPQAAGVPGKVSYIQSYPSALVECQKCSLVYRDPKPPEEEIVAQYEKESFCPEYDELWRRSWRRIFTRTLKEVEKRKPQKGKLLDIGCQLGLFPEMAQESGWDAYGVDPSAYTVEIAKRHRVNVFQGVLKEANFPDEFFGVVTSWLVFENLPHFKADLSEIHRVLRQDGLLVIKISNVDFYRFWRKVVLSAKEPLNYPSEVIFARLHLMGFPYQYGFNSRTIVEALKGSGFKGIEVRNYKLLCSIDKDLRPEILLIESLGKRAINVVSKAVYVASKGKKVIGPWLEVYARKSKT